MPAPDMWQRTVVSNAIKSINQALELAAYGGENAKMSKR